MTAFTSPPGTAGYFIGVGIHRENVHTDLAEFIHERPAPAAFLAAHTYKGDIAAGYEQVDYLFDSKYGGIPGESRQEKEELTLVQHN